MSRCAPRSFERDAGLGVRYNNLRQKTEANVDIDPGAAFRMTLGGTEVWWEPTLMLRGGAQLNDRWTAGARAEIGGFGVGGSDLHWNVFLGADYKPWQIDSVLLGWQFYGIDFSTTRPEGKFAYDVFQTGSYMGASFNF